MEVGAPEIDNPLPLRIFDECVANVPLAGNGPVEYPGAAGYFPDRQIYMPAEMPQRLANAISRDAAANRIELRS